jgi:hypothetical protein
MNGRKITRTPASKLLFILRLGHPMRYLNNQLHCTTFLMDTAYLYRIPMDVLPDEHR